MDFKEVLVWLSGVGAVLAVSWTFDYFKFAWFENLQPKNKQLVFLGISAFIGVGAKLILNFVSPEIIEIISEYFVVVFAIFAYMFLGDQFHERTSLQ